MAQYVLHIDSKDEALGVPVSTLKIGELARAVNGSYAGQIILRTYSGAVSLTNPRATWGFEDGGDSCGPSVRPLSPGTIVKLEVKV